MSWLTAGRAQPLSEETVGRGGLDASAPLGQSCLGMRTGERGDVWVVILNYRTPDMTMDAVRSIADEMRAVPGRKAIVVDGGSGDDSAARIGAAIEAEGLGDYAELKALSENRGYAFGNNSAIQDAMAADPKPEFVLVLNPDTEARPGAIQALIDFARARPEVGLVGSRLEDPDGSPQHSAFRFPSLVNEFSESLRFGPFTRLVDEHVISMGILEEPTRVDWVAGASLLIRMEVFEQVGLFDDAYFLYFEETDFCLQAARHGWQCWYVPDSRVVHHVGGSTGVSDARKTRSRRPKYWYESRERYLSRNLGTSQKRVADVLFAAGTVGYQLRCKLKGEESSDPPKLLRDFVVYNFLGGRYL